jgi:hypothetical protein
MFRVVSLHYIVLNVGKGFQIEDCVRREQETSTDTRLDSFPP